MSMFSLEFLPVELIHSIFPYLWAHEILYAFAQLNTYFDSILASYDRYLICLSSTIKHQFDLVCRLIQPVQVISIAIAETNDTPDQLNIFFSKFNLQQLTNLRSFAINSNEQSVFRKLDLLCQFNNFQSLVLPKISRNYWCLFGHHLETTLPRLKQLITNQYPLSKPLNNLKYLTVTHCYSYNLEYILREMSNLHSLNITISLDILTNWSVRMPMMSGLRRLTLCISCKVIQSMLSF